MFSSLLRSAESIFLLTIIVILLGAISLFSYEPNPFDNPDATVVPVETLAPVSVDGGS